MKNLIYFFLLISFFSLSQEEITVIDFASGNYPVGEKVKILFGKDWRPVTAIDSADYYRIVKFKEKNMPSGKITDFFITGEKQAIFYASYFGLDLKGIDSLRLNGPNISYYKNGNKKISLNYVEGLQQFERISYYESGEIEFTRNYVDGLEQGQGIGYYKSGEIFFTANYVDGILQGQQIGYYKSGEVEYTLDWADGLRQGQQIYYFKSAEKRAIVNWVDDLKQGKWIDNYESGELEVTANYVDDLRQGKQIGYFKSGEVRDSLYRVDNLKQGQLIRYYESGKVEFTRNYIDDLRQGEEIWYYESGEVEYRLNYVDDLKQGLVTYFLKNGDINYDELYLDDKRVDRKIALVIGNADYDKGKLSNPVNDANLIAESLEKLDFEVFLHTNLATEGEMKDAIAEFGRKRKDYEIGFVYYAGHGIQLNNDNYLLPVKEEFNDQYDVEDNAVSMQKVLRYLESTRENQLNFIVLDACRDNPFESNWNKTRSLKGAGLAKTPPPTGSLIAFSTDHGQTAADGDGGNSLYSQALAEKLLEENVSIEQVFKNVRTEVLKLSGDTQSPVEESKLTGDVFYLNKTEE